MGTGRNLGRGIQRLRIGPRLALGFLLIIVLMLGMNATLVWQLQLIRAQTAHLNSIDRKLIAVLHVHTNLVSFYDRLLELVRAEDADRMAKDAKSLRTQLISDRALAREALSRLPPDVQLDTTRSLTLDAIQASLEAQLLALTELSERGDWAGVQLRLTNEIRPLQSLTSSLVADVSGQVDDERAAAFVNIHNANRQILLTVSIAAALTVFIACVLGVALTRSISEPLGRLMEGAQALARGDFDNRVVLRGDDELAHLGRVFNDTAGQLRKLYETLRTSEAYLAEAQRLTHTGSYAWSVATRQIIHWSRETYRLWDFDPEAGVPDFEAVRARIHPGDRLAADSALQRTIREGVENDVVFRVLHLDGSTRYIQSVGHAVRSAAGDVVEVVGTNVDITDRRRTEETLEETRAALAHVARVATLGELTASIAHEVNQPLSGIMTNASTCLRLLGANPPKLEAVAETARRTLRDSKRAAEVVSRLREMFRKKETARESVDVNEAIREVIALSLRQIQAGRAAVRMDLADDLPRVVGDRVQLQQVLLNLILNAADAMSAVEDRPRELAVATAREEGGGLRVAVRDSGIGLDPEAGERVFQAFYTTKKEGMGMGLSIARSIVERHGGRLWVAPSDGPGATFVFTLPGAPRPLTADEA